MYGNSARLLALILTAALAGCGDGKPPQAGGPPPPTVTVAKPVTQTVSDFDEYVGRFVALEFGRGAGAGLGLPRPDPFH